MRNLLLIKSQFLWQQKWMIGPINSTSAIHLYTYWFIILELLIWQNHTRKSGICIRFPCIYYSYKGARTKFYTFILSNRRKTSDDEEEKVAFYLFMWIWKRDGLVHILDKCNNTNEINTYYIRCISKKRIL